MKRGLLYYPMYVNDFDEDPNVLAMSLAEEGLYVACLNESWKRGGIPDDPKALARIIRKDRAEVLRAWPGISSCWIPGSSGLLVNPRQEKERQIAAEKSAKAKESASLRYANANANATPDAAASALLCASDSDSNSLFSEVKTNEKERTSVRQKERFDEFWAAYPRKKAKPQARTTYDKSVKTEEQHAVKMLALQADLPELLARRAEARPYPSTWINQQHELDEADPMPNGTAPRYESPQERAIREA